MANSKKQIVRFGGQNNRLRNFSSERSERMRDLNSKTCRNDCRRKTKTTRNRSEVKAIRTKSRKKVQTAKPPNYCAKVKNLKHSNSS